MSTLANGLALIVNGALASVHYVATPVTLAVVASVVALGFLARFEVEELDRQAQKPTIQRH